MSEETESQANLENTARLVELFKTERSDRDADWVNSFLADVPLAAMRTGEEQVISGPDGFLYFCLFIPEEGEKFSPVCLDDVIGFCSKEGLGITVFNTH